MSTFHAQRAAQQSSAALEHPNTGRPQRRERQTRLQEHLRSVKPGSRSSSPNNAKQQQQQQRQTAAGSASMGRSARKSVPTAKKAAAADVSEPAPETSSSGRPKRRVGRARTALFDADSSDDEASEAFGRSGAADVDASGPGELAEDIGGRPPTPRRSTGAKGRPQPRSAIPLAARDEAPEPSPATKGRASTGRKTPAKQVQGSQRRKREASGGSSSAQSTQASPYAVDAGQMQKQQFRSILARHGFHPQEDVLDRAIHTLSSAQQEFTIDSFLRVLGTLDPNATPLRRLSAGSGSQLSVSVPPLDSVAAERSGGASTLNSPLTPASASNVNGRFLPSPPLSHSPIGRSQAGPYAYSVSQPPAPAPAMMAADSLPVPPAAFAPSAPSAPPPIRPSLFATRSMSTPNLSTLDSAALASANATAQQVPATAAHPAPTTPLGGGLFATSVAGMGRVALSRRSMFGQLGSGSGPNGGLSSVAESSPAASFHQLSPPSRSSPSLVPSPTTSVGAGNGLLPPFALGAQPLAPGSSRSRASSLSKSSSPVKPAADDSRLAKLRSWLDDDDEDTAEEEEAKVGSDQPAEASASLKASAATSKFASGLAALERVTPDLQVPAASLPVADHIDGIPEAIMPKDVGAASLRQSQKRPAEQAELEEAAAIAKMATRASTRSSTKDKGKSKAAAACSCGQVADGQLETTECAQCETTYHLACVDSRETPFVCSQCAGANNEVVSTNDVEAGRRTPELASKRVRIGTNSTPHLLSEPTFVASTPLSAPRGDAFGPLVGDLALAPSPTASPVRRFTSTQAPTSPPVQARTQLPIPLTPRFDDAMPRGPGDYSPTSPQNTRARAARTRLHSNTGAAFLGGAGGSEWLDGWDTHQFPVADSMQAQPPSSALSSLVEDDWRMSSWSDVNMTPSRALSGNTPATSTSSSVWETPFVHSSPQQRNRMTYSMGLRTRTPSQDLLTMLDREQAAAPPHHSEPAHHTFSQRLFGATGSAPESPRFESPTHAYNSMSLAHPASPLNLRRLSSQNQARKTSLGDGLGRPPFGLPKSPEQSHAHLPAHMHGLGSASMKPSFSAPGGRLVDLLPSLGGDPNEEQQQFNHLLL